MGLVSDSFNIYNKKGTNANSGRRHTAKNKSIGLAEKKVPNTARNESSKSTPCNPLLKAKGLGNSQKNMQSTGNMLTLNHGVLKGCSTRYLPFSSQSNIIPQPKKSSAKAFRSSVSSRTGTVFSAGEGS